MPALHLRLRHPLTWLFSLMMLATVSFAALNYTASAPTLVLRGVVYHISDSSQALRAIRHIDNQRAVDSEIAITVVAVGGGIDFLIDNAKDAQGNTYASMIDSQMLNGVEFKVCRNTLKAKNLREGDMTPGVEFVDAGIDEITRLQLENGYAYIKP
ncbi:DsrE family protein [Microbulbifer pacificus]|uniref:DsrE family protein n=1 Tax=Microbulbifer pacificus TaxID=407164 RepID=A0AAU0MXK4_9GAMM|nr:DsrE family protein [Microbulbifer pacificus]WOX04738.1 DsrE family protein [Microbulbifer pacificus]